MGADADRSDYFTKVLEDDLKAIIKPQYVDQMPRAIKATDRRVGSLIKSRAQMENLEQILDVLELRHVIDREIQLLSGGELQRYAPFPPPLLFFVCLFSDCHGPERGCKVLIEVGSPSG